jgi:hypothetical protein
MLYIASVKNDTHEASFLVGASVCTPGDTGMAYNEATNELLVHHWSRERNVNKKTVISNAS